MGPTSYEIDSHEYNHSRIPKNTRPPKGREFVRKPPSSANSEIRSAKGELVRTVHGCLESEIATHRISRGFNRGQADT